MPAEQPPQYFVWARHSVLLAYAALYLVLFYGCWVHGPDDVLAKIVLWLLVSCGLMLVLPGLIGNRRRSYIWLCFIVMIYFVWSVQSVFSQQLDQSGTANFVGGWYNYALLFNVIAIFVSGMLAARWFPR